MKLQILYDNTIAEKGFLPGWGFSYLIDNRILFDTGEYSELLFHNIDLLGIDLEQIEKVVISHDHYDHRDGLWQLLKRRKGLPVYMCKGFSETTKQNVSDLGGEVHLMDHTCRLEKNIYLVGEFEFIYKGDQMVEQSLALITEKGITILTGCSHPGIIKIVREAQDHFADVPLYMVAGGFHLKDGSEEEIEKIVNELLSANIRKIAPTHCSGTIAQDIFKYYFKDNYVILGAGTEINI